MSTFKKIFLFIFCFTLIIGCILYLYLTSSDWVNYTGWSGSYEKDSPYMNGIESLKVDCTKESKLLYSYYIENGEITLTITKDAKGEELLKSIKIDKTCDSSVLLNFSGVNECYIFETAIPGTIATSEAWIQQHLTKWEQYLQRKQDKNELKQMIAN